MPKIFIPSVMRGTDGAALAVNYTEARAILLDNLTKAKFVDQYLDAADAFFTKSDSGNFNAGLPAAQAYDNDNWNIAEASGADITIWIQFTAAYPVKFSGCRAARGGKAGTMTFYAEYQDYKGDWIELASKSVLANETWEPTWNPVLALAFRIRIVPAGGHTALVYEIDPKVVA